MADARKLRRAMASPGRSLLQGIVEADGTAAALRLERDTSGPPKPGRSVEGRIPIVGAVELPERGEPRRIRLKTMDRCSSGSFRAAIAETSGSGARVITDGWSGCSGLPDSPRVSRESGRRTDGPAGRCRT